MNLNDYYEVNVKVTDYHDADEARWENNFGNNKIRSR